MVATISSLKNAAQAAFYHHHDDYYFKDNGPSSWSGKTAQRLGLSGPVDQGIFRQLLAGKIPAELNGGIPAQIHRGGQKQRPGVDLTFSAPRSFALLALSGKRPDLVKLFDEAVQETLGAIEKEAGCRVTQDKQTREAITGNYVFAEFNHSTSRPVTLAQLENLGPKYAAEAARLRESGAAYAVDMNLHKHVLALNMTWCEETNSYKAIDNHPLFRDQMAIGAMFHSNLATKCRAAGLALRDFGDNGTFELAAVDQRLVDKFSLRSALIEAELAKQGLTRETATAKQLQTATLKTRNAKDHGVDRSELSADWQERLDRYEKELGVSLETALTAEFVAEEGGPRTSRAGIESGLRHYMERSSIVKEADVVRWAIAHSRGYYTIADIRRELDYMKQSGELIAGEVTKTRAPGAEKQDRAFNEADATPGMVKYARAIAEQKGLPPPESSKFSDIRSFLDIHAPQKIGIEERGTGYDSAAGNPTRQAETVLTTRAAQERERQMLQSVQSGHGTMQAVMTHADADRILSARNKAMQHAVWTKAIENGKTPCDADAAAAKIGLNAGQQDAARLILTSSDRVNVILGVAGAGKSFTLGQAKTIIEEQAATMGLKIHGVAPSHQAKSELKQVTGAGDTLQAFLTSPKEWQKLGKSHLLIVDEAGMASTKQLAELERISTKQGFRYFLVGDLRQTAAVEAGKPLEQIAKVTKTIEMNESVRHKTAHLQESARLAASGKMAESLAPLSVKEIKDASERRKYLADRFVSIGRQAEDNARASGKTDHDARAAGLAARKETLLLTTTNAGRQEINRFVRQNLGLAGQGKEIDTLHQKDTTAESRRFLMNYKTGDVLQFSAAYRSLGVNSGDRLTVAEIQSDRLILSDKTGLPHEFKPTSFKTENWGLYAPEKIELAVGDHVRMRENTAQFQNGDFGTVLFLDGKTLKIQSEKEPQQVWTIALNDRATCIDHGYAMTAHGAQGATRDRTLVDMDTTSLTLSKETAYVMNTRSRRELEIVTNNAAALPSAISQAAYKPNALDTEHSHVAEIEI